MSAMSREQIVEAVRAWPVTSRILVTFTDGSVVGGAFIGFDAHGLIVNTLGDQYYYYDDVSRVE